MRAADRWQRSCVKDITTPAKQRDEHSIELDRLEFGARVAIDFYYPRKFDRK